MRLKRILLASAVAGSLALAFAAAPGQAASGKPSGEGRAGIGTGSAAADGATRSKGIAKVSPTALAASNQIQSRILGYVKAHGTKYSFGSYADPATGKAVIETDAPASVLSSLTNGYGGVAEIRRTDTVDHYSRRDDVPAFWGGNGITLAGTAPSARCSSGYAVKNAAGTRFMVTAGHCFSNGQTAVTELGGRLVGSVSGNGLPSQDMELISGQSYGSSIFVGGVDSSTGNHVASAADPVVGFADYCHSGRTTGENCGHTVQSVTATVCTSSGCKSPVIAFTGGYLPQGGDSGSPFYAKSVSGTEKHIRGHVIAGNGTTEYAEKWSRVAARFGVSIGS